MHLISKIPYRFMGAGLIGGLFLLFYWPMVFIPVVTTVMGGLLDIAFDKHMEKMDQDGLYDDTRSGR